MLSLFIYPYDSIADSHAQLCVASPNCTTELMLINRMNVRLVPFFWMPIKYNRLAEYKLRSYYEYIYAYIYYL